MAKKIERAVNDHGITCSCPRCCGLRRYPQPTKCDWCNKVHAGDSNNCEGIYRTNDIDWSEEDPAIEELCTLVKQRIRDITIMVRSISNGENVSRFYRTSRRRIPGVG